jgi:DTW domain-containing protein YfiP
MIFEVWRDPRDNSITLFPASLQDKNRQLLSKRAKRLHLIVAGSWDAAMRRHHEIMGWEPYVPMNLHFLQGVAHERR